MKREHSRVERNRGNIKERYEMKRVEEERVERKDEERIERRERERGERR